MGVDRPAGQNERREGDAPVRQGEEVAAEVVDFDALHAALGDLPPPPTPSSPTLPETMSSESHGRANAAYSSIRPHAIPVTRLPASDDRTAPAVIVASDDTVPTGPPPQMTMPLGARYPGLRPPVPVRSTAPYVAEAAPEAIKLAVPVPRRPRTPTIVVRTRGPTKVQKLLVFMAMLLVFVGGGIVFLIYGKRLGVDVDIGLGARRPSAAVTVPTATATATAVVPSASAAVALPANSTATTPSSLPAASSVSPVAVAAPGVSVTASAVASATPSVRAVPRKPRPQPQPQPQPSLPPPPVSQSPY